MPPTLSPKRASSQHNTNASHLLPANNISRMQVRNQHNLLADFQAELGLYEQSGALLNFLSMRRTEYEGDGSRSLPQLIEALVVTMYEYDILQKEDILLTQAWLQDLSAAGYKFPRHARVEGGL